MVEGHPERCGCPSCLSLERIGVIIKLGSSSSQFLDSAVRQLRLVEGELRDELGKLPLAQVNPSSGVEGPPGAGALHPTTGKQQERGGGDEKGDPLPTAFATGAKTPPAPSAGEKSPKIPAKEEKNEEGNKEPLIEAKGIQEEKRDRSRDRRRRRARAKKKDSRGEDADEEAKKTEKKEAASSSKKKRSEERQKEKRRETSLSEESVERKDRRNKKSEERGERHSPSSLGGKEKKRRDERPPEPPLRQPLPNQKGAVG